MVPKIRHPPFSETLTLNPKTLYRPLMDPFKEPLKDPKVRYPPPLKVPPFSETLVYGPKRLPALCNCLFVASSGTLQVPKGGSFKGLGLGFRV